MTMTMTVKNQKRKRLNKGLLIQIAIFLSSLWGVNTASALPIPPENQLTADTICTFFPGPFQSISAPETVSQGFKDTTYFSPKHVVSSTNSIIAKDAMQEEFDFSTNGFAYISNSSKIYGTGPSHAVAFPVDKFKVPEGNQSCDGYACVGSSGAFAPYAENNLRSKRSGRSVDFVSGSSYAFLTNLAGQSKLTEISATDDELIIKPNNGATSSSYSEFELKDLTRYLNAGETYYFESLSLSGTANMAVLNGSASNPTVVVVNRRITVKDKATLNANGTPGALIILVMGRVDQGHASTYPQNEPFSRFSFYLNGSGKVNALLYSYTRVNISGGVFTGSLSAREAYIDGTVLLSTPSLCDPALENQLDASFSPAVSEFRTLSDAPYLDQKTKQAVTLSVNQFNDLPSTYSGQIKVQLKNKQGIGSGACLTKDPTVNSCLSLSSSLLLNVENGQALSDFYILSDLPGDFFLEASPTNVNVKLFTSKTTAYKVYPSVKDFSVDRNICELFPHGLQSYEGAKNSLVEFKSLKYHNAYASTPVNMSGQPIITNTATSSLVRLLGFDTINTTHLDGTKPLTRPETICGGFPCQNGGMKPIPLKFNSMPQFSGIATLVLKINAGQKKTYYFRPNPDNPSEFQYKLDTDLNWLSGAGYDSLNLDTTSVSSAATGLLQLFFEPGTYYFNRITMNNALNASTANSFWGDRIDMSRMPGATGRVGLHVHSLTAYRRSSINWRLANGLSPDNYSTNLSAEELAPVNASDDFIIIARYSNPHEPRTGGTVKITGGSYSMSMDRLEKTAPFVNASIYSEDLVDMGIATYFIGAVTANRLITTQSTKGSPSYVVLDLKNINYKTPTACGVTSGGGFQAVPDAIDTASLGADTAYGIQNRRPVQIMAFDSVGEINTDYENEVTGYFENIERNKEGELLPLPSSFCFSTEVANCISLNGISRENPIRFIMKKGVISEIIIKENATDADGVHYAGPSFYLSSELPSFEDQTLKGVVLNLTGLSTGETKVAGPYTFSYFDLCSIFPGPLQGIAGVADNLGNPIASTLVIQNAPEMTVRKFNSLNGKGAIGYDMMINTALKCGDALCENVPSLKATNFYDKLPKMPVGLTRNVNPTCKPPNSQGFITCELLNGDDIGDTLTVPGELSIKPGIYFYNKIVISAAGSIQRTKNSVGPIVIYTKSISMITGRQIPQDPYFLVIDMNDASTDQSLFQALIKGSSISYNSLFASRGVLDLNDLLTLSGATVTANRVVADSPHIVHESYFKPVESCRLGDVMKYYMDVDTKSAIVASCDEISMTVTKKFGTGMCEQDDGYTILENGVETSRCGAPVDANFFIVESNGTRRTLTSDEICVNLGGGCLNSNANKAFSIPMDGIAQRVLKLSAKTGSSVGELTNIQMQFTSKLDPLSQFDKTYNGRLDLLFGPYSFIQSTPIFSFKFDTTDVANIIAGKPLHGILMALKASEDESDSASQCETPYDNQTLILNFDTLWADNTSTTDEALTYSVDKGPLLPLPSDKIVTAETDTTGLNLGPNQVQVTFDEKSQVALSFLVEDAGAAKLDITNTKSDTIDNSDGSHNDICPDDQTANCQVTAKGLLHLYSRPYTFAICDGEEGPKYGQELPFATESAGLFSAAHFAMAGQTFKTMIKPVAWREGDPDLDPLTGQLVIGTEPAEDPNDPAIDLLDGNLSWVTMSDLCGRPALNGFFTNSPRGPYTSMVEINGVPELLMPLEGQSISINGDRSLLNNDPSRVNFSENVAITTHIATDVGIVKWDVVDNDYFGMTINPATLNLGRFDPSHFTIASKSYEHDSTSNGCVRNSNVGHSVSLEASLPIELTDYTCSFLGSGLRNDFTYLGQDFMINYEIRPMAEGMLARNYQYFDDNLKATFKLHVLKNGAIDNSVEAQTLYTLLNETAGWNDGVYTTDYNKVDPLFDPDTENPLLPHHLKSRATLPRQKQSALMNVQIAVEKQEPSGTNNIPFTNEVTTINGSQYSLLDNTLTLLYGEFRVLSHQGHQNYLPLPMVMGAYYFDSSTIADGHDGFVLNSQDNLRYGSFEDLTYQVTRTPGNAAIGPILNNGSLFSWVDHDSNQLFDFNNQVVQPTLNHHSAQPMYDSNGQLSIANINGDLVDSIQFQLTDGLAKRSSYLTKESHLFYAIYDTGAPEAVSEMGFRLNNFDQIYPWLASSPPVATFPFGKAKNKNRATDGKILFRSLRY